MQDDKYHAALSQLPNRYSLCHALGRATRRLHIPSTRTQDTTNQVLLDIGSGKYGAAIKLPTAPLPSEQ